MLGDMSLQKNRSHRRRREPDHPFAGSAIRHRLAHRLDRNAASSRLTGDQSIDPLAPGATQFHLHVVWGELKRHPKRHADLSGTRYGRASTGTPLKAD
jgi:hypothetical protein